jgi:hypothetical protein
VTLCIAGGPTFTKGRGGAAGSPRLSLVPGSIRYKALTGMIQNFAGGPRVTKCGTSDHFFARPCECLQYNQAGFHATVHTWPPKHTCHSSQFWPTSRPFQQGKCAGVCGPANEPFNLETWEHGNWDIQILDRPDPWTTPSHRRSPWHPPLNIHSCECHRCGPATWPLLHISHTEKEPLENSCTQFTHPTKEFH